MTLRRSSRIRAFTRILVEQAGQSRDDTWLVSANPFDIIVFFACEEDISHELPDAPLPEAVAAVLHHFGELTSVGGELRPGIADRLDRDTSGVLVIARTDRAHRSLGRHFHDREVEQTKPSN
jgi:hypothetical protein